MVICKLRLLIDGWVGDQNNFWIMRSNQRVLDDLDQVRTELTQRNALIVGIRRETGIVGSEKDRHDTNLGFSRGWDDFRDYPESKVRVVTTEMILSFSISGPWSEY